MKFKRTPEPPTACPHCGADPGSQLALSQHLRFWCPVIRPLPIPSNDWVD